MGQNRVEEKKKERIEEKRTENIGRKEIGERNREILLTLVL